MLDHLISLIAPHECLGCSQEGQLLCGDCAAALTALPQRCYRCRALSPGNVTCTACRRASKLHTVQAMTYYRDLAKDLVWRLKFSHARTAADDMVRLVVDRCVFEADTLLVHVPTATGRVRQRGYDQAALLAKGLARKTGLPHRPLLARSGQARQVGAGRKERLEHLSTAFRVRHGAQLAGRHVVLIDDVLTTGATLEAAAAVLKRAGAKQVDAIVFAQA